jgi:hypothetical protein
MIDVVIRLENVTGPDGRPVDEHEGDVLAEGLRAVTAGLLAKMAYTADAAKVARPAVPADVVADRTADPAVAAQAEQARRRAWHEDDTL